MHYAKYKQDEKKRKNDDIYGSYESYGKYKQEEEVNRRDDSDDSYEDYDYESEEMKQKLASLGKGSSDKRDRRYRSNRYINDLLQ